MCAGGYSSLLWQLMGKGVGFMRLMPKQKV